MCQTPRGTTGCLPRRDRDVHRRCRRRRVVFTRPALSRRRPRRGRSARGRRGAGRASWRRIPVPRRRSRRPAVPRPHGPPARACRRRGRPEGRAESSGGGVLGELALLTGSPVLGRGAGRSRRRAAGTERSAFRCAAGGDPELGRGLRGELARQLQRSRRARRSLDEADRLRRRSAGGRRSIGERLGSDDEREARRHRNASRRFEERRRPTATWRCLQGRRPRETRFCSWPKAPDVDVGCVRPPAGRPHVLLADADTPVAAPRQGAIWSCSDRCRPAGHAGSMRSLPRRITSSTRRAYELGVARVARRIAGRSLGLVLSGGGARGFAHIGVIAAIAEAGLRVDRLGGAAWARSSREMAALGLDAEQIRGLCRDELVRAGAVQRLDAAARRADPLPQGGRDARARLRRAPGRGAVATALHRQRDLLLQPNGRPPARPAARGGRGEHVDPRPRAAASRAEAGFSSTAACSTTCPST